MRSHAWWRPARNSWHTRIGQGMVVPHSVCNSRADYLALRRTAGRRQRRLPAKQRSAGIRAHGVLLGAQSDSVAVGPRAAKPPVALADDRQFAAGHHGRPLPADRGGAPSAPPKGGDGERSWRTGRPRGSPTPPLRIRRRHLDLGTGGAPPCPARRARLATPRQTGTSSRHRRFPRCEDTGLSRYSSIPYNLRRELRPDGLTGGIQRCDTRRRRSVVGTVGTGLVEGSWSRARR